MENDFKAFLITVLILFLGLGYSYYSFYNLPKIKNTKTDYPQVGNIQIVEVGMRYKPINTCNSTDYDYHLDKNQYCKTNYWAGAKQVCAAMDMELPNIETYYYLYKNGVKNNNSRYYWSSDEQNANFGRSFSLCSGTEYNGGYYKNFQDNVLCIKR
ncbi:hypothetical protein J6S88_04460 [bacterium]|nr:hypothetical protein [bacterium]